MIKQCLERHQLETALFWYDKLVTLTGGNIKDVYWYADVLCRSGQYKRVCTLLDIHKIDKKCLAGRHLKAKCHYESKEYNTALCLLNDLDRHPLYHDNTCMEAGEGVEGVPVDNASLLSGMFTLKGQIYEAMDNRELAKECYKQALMLDCCCYEAFNNLIQHHMLNGTDENDLIESMKAKTYPSEVNQKIAIRLYERMLKKYNKLQHVAVESLGVLETNMDVQVMKAETHFYNCNFHACHDVTSHILRQDPYNPTCLPVHVSVLVELKKTKDLFSLAHKLVDLCPDKEISWFSVGAYYFLINKQEQTRRYLSKSTSLNRLFAPAWLMYGHSFALENEHDQAMAAYFSASKLMEGCHLPLMYIALEYMLTNNSRLAEKFFREAGNIAPEDPFVLHEIGIIEFHNHQYTEAEIKFLLVVKKIKKFHTNIQPDKWEPLYNNLGHVSRKLKKYSKSLGYHQKALTISPHNASTYTALGFTYSLMGELEQAINCFHKSLGLRKDDSFTTSMLNMVTDQHILEYKPYPGLDTRTTSYFKDTQLKLHTKVQPKDSLVETDPGEEILHEQFYQMLDGSSLHDEEMEDAF